MNGSVGVDKFDPASSNVDVNLTSPKSNRFDLVVWMRVEFPFSAYNTLRRLLN